MDLYQLPYLPSLTNFSDYETVSEISFYYTLPPPQPTLHLSNNKRKNVEEGERSKKTQRTMGKKVLVHGHVYQ